MPRNKAFEQEKALEQAMHVFWAKGYHGTSVQDLVDALQINRSSLYATFEDKRKLFLKAIQLYRETQVEGILQLLKSGVAAPEALGTLFDQAIREATAGDYRSSCLMVNTANELGASDAEIGQILQEHFQQMTEALAICLYQSRQQGLIGTAENAWVLAYALVNALNGLRAVAKAGSSAEQLLSIKKMALSLLQ